MSDDAAATVVEAPGLRRVVRGGPGLVAVTQGLAALALLLLLLVVLALWWDRRRYAERRAAREASRRDGHRRMRLARRGEAR